MLASVKPRLLKVVEEGAPVFNNDNTTFHSKFKVIELYTSEVDRIKGLLNDQDFLDRIKSIDGFNKTSSSWKVLEMEEILAVGTVGTIYKPKLSFDGIQDKKAVLMWSYPDSLETLAMRGGGYELKTFSVDWHSSPNDLTTTYSTG